MLKIQEFNKLTDAEAKLLYQAPAMIAVLIAAADSKIDEAETSWAKKVVGFRQEVGNEVLFNYYEMAESLFNETLESLLKEEKGTHERISDLETTLAALTPILAKIGSKFALELVKSWKSLAKQVAKATGGVLGFGGISEQEKRLMDLKMIQL